MMPMSDSPDLLCPACGLGVAEPGICVQCGPVPDAITRLRSNSHASGIDHHAAERRQTTVLFCEIFESTALSLRLDPEDMMEVLQQFVQTARAVVDQHQG